MKNSYVTTIVVLMAFSLSQNVQAQKITDFINKTAKSLENELSNTMGKMVEDKLVDLAVKKISSRLDSIFQESYESDTTSTGEKTKESYAGFLANINKAANVPEAYRFTSGVEMLVTDDKGKESKYIHYFSEEGGVLGIHSEEVFMVLDATNEIMVSYNIEEKVAFAFGKGMMKLGSSLISDDFIPQFDISKSVGTKSILGYTCQKYIGNSDAYEFEAYVAEDFPVSFKEEYTAVTKVFMTSKFQESLDNIPGMALESKSIDEDGKITTTEAIKEIKELVVLKKQDFDFNEN